MGVVGNMGINRQIISIYGVGLLIFGCSNTPYLTKKDSVADREKHQSVDNFYNAGMIRCSVNDLAFDDVCDYAVYKEKKSPIKLVIENVAIKTAIKYRILYFNNGQFKSKNEKDVIHFHKTESNHYQISIGRENYLLPIRVLKYQPEPVETKDDKKVAETPEVEEKAVSIAPPQGTKRKFKR